jgi:hypothetical protein
MTSMKPLASSRLLNRSPNRAEFVARLNSTEAQDLFADTAWMPSELTEVVHAVIGCENFPDDVDDLAAIFNHWQIGVANFSKTSHRNKWGNEGEFA